MNCVLSPVPDWAAVTDGDNPPEPAAAVCSTAFDCPVVCPALPAVGVVVLSVLWVQPATRIPAMRIAEATSIIILLFFI